VLHNIPRLQPIQVGNEQSPLSACEPRRSHTFQRMVLAGGPALTEPEAVEDFNVSVLAPLEDTATVRLMENYVHL
jgi:hypothetical protein